MKKKAKRTRRVQKEELGVLQTLKNTLKKLWRKF